MKTASNQKIARELGIEVATVATHVHRIYRKLGVQSRTEATSFALTSGFFRDLQDLAPTAD